MAVPEGPVLAAGGLTRDFGDLRAVDGVNLAIGRGTMTGLIGPNGAGKSTLFDLLAGVLPPSAGRVELMGRDVTALPPDRRFAAGLGRTFQIPRPFARLSVLDNVMAAPTGQTGERLWGPFLAPARVRAEERRHRERAAEVLEFCTLGALHDHPAGKLSGGQTKLLELARVLMGDPEVILLDEPAAGVNPALTEVLIKQIEALNARGTTFVVVEHDMDLVMRHCAPIVAMAGGRVVYEGSAAGAQSDPLLVEAYLGTVHA